ncbi:ParB N-terminal domain-containing protein [Roseococcus sp. SDR]|uniref:site-specific DNA-methyltransferase n=1 Tax=Roseococcus sp. SDR TaxID=2835532 RepID=UPI001BCF9807|nr:DNA methyltransferase [Roseococcus sp. SDR]MBS7789391.1 ParB N-terminal domain-containing protein [Roseococcus sp. SDR]MBV1844705.1 ParB N-terminal domain-containing protein [Roseococcus sp. SDR]
MTLPWMAAKILLRPVAELRAHPGNARVHGAAQIEQIKASMLAFGFTNPLLVDEAGVLIAGHGRLEAAVALGIEKVPTIVLRHLSAAQKEALRLADNRIAENATWDQALLRDALAAVQAAPDLDLATLGFSAAELDDILAAAGDAVSDGDAPETLSAPAVQGGGDGAAGTDEVSAEDDPADAEPDPPRQAVARVGDIWRMGDHRLACGDSTNSSTIARVMGPERAALLFTSPPYGNQRDYTTGGVLDWDALMQGVFQHLDIALARDAQVLVNLGLIHRDNEWQPYWSGWLDWMRAQGWRRFGLYAWDQGPGLPGDWNGRLSPAFELLFHFNREARRPNKIIPCRWAGHVNSEKGGLRAKDGTVGEWQHAGQGVQETRIPDSVLRITRHKARGIETEHPAVFPVALPEFLMRAYADDGDIVFEPFAGAGTSIIAGQRTGRRVRAIELAPAYVDLAIARWRMLHPELPVILDDGGHGIGPDYDAVAAARAGEAVADAA